MCLVSWSSETDFGTVLIAAIRSLTTLVIPLAFTIDAPNLAAALWLRATKLLKSPIEAFPITPPEAALARKS
tara:strand:+ start:437 stop:652 length:216 start_codon:yes stop_codon:yes gene_type:complete